VKVPHSLHSFHRIVDTEHEDGRITFRGGFWNYFSIGMDAQVSYTFNTTRQEHPEKFKKQITNQAQYAKITCAQGWFCASCLHPASKNINKLAKIKVARKGEQWQDLEISKSIRAIVVLNLPSFSGGLNPWGEPGDKKSKERGLTAPFVDDGLLEVVGFRDAWQGALLFTPNGHGVRLAQTHRLRVEFHSGAATETYMRMDGEPWQQPLPKAPKPTVLEITQLGQSLVLATKKCIARTDSTAPAMKPGDEVGVKNQGGANWKEDQMPTGPRSSTSSSSSSDGDPEMNRKFGAASTFRRSDVK
jgi:diacylglycerol kinase (ATP)